MSDDNAFFGDSDPEDAWDDGDPVEDKLRVLERLVEALKQSDRDERFNIRRREGLRLAGKLNEAIRVNQNAGSRLENITDALEELG